MHLLARICLPSRKFKFGGPHVPTRFLLHGRLLRPRRVRYSRHVVPRAEQRRERHALRRWLLWARAGRAYLHQQQLRGAVHLRCWILLWSGQHQRGRRILPPRLILHRRVHDTVALLSGG